MLLTALISAESFSQQNNTTPVILKVPASKFKEKTPVRDLIPGLPANCAISAVISISSAGGLKDFMLRGDTISGELRDRMKHAKKIFVEDLKTDCSGTLTRHKSYKITVE